MRSVVADGPAFKAGIKVNDVVTAINGQEIENIAQVPGMLKGRWSGDKITLTVKRGEETLEVELTLGSKTG